MLFHAFLFLTCRRISRVNLTSFTIAEILPQASSVATGEGQERTREQTGTVANPPDPSSRKRAGSPNFERGADGSLLSDLTHGNNPSKRRKEGGEPLFGALSSIREESEGAKESEDARPHPCLALNANPIDSTFGVYRDQNEYEGAVFPSLDQPWRDDHESKHRTSFAFGADTHIA